MLTKDSKLYMQLAPDKHGVEMLKDLQRTLPDQARIVDESELHLSILHIGKVSRTIASLQSFTNIDADKIVQESNKLATQLQSLMNEYSETDFELTPIGLELLGRGGNTLVVSYRETSNLNELHAKSLQLLRSFFENCGVTDVTSFMKQDDNFKYALSLKPHITISKSYVGKLPSTQLDEVTLHCMDVLQ